MAASNKLEPDELSAFIKFFELLIEIDKAGE